MSDDRGDDQTSAPTADAERWEAVARYLAGESAPDEARQVERWLSEHPEDGGLLAALDALAPGTARADAGAGARWTPSRPIATDDALAAVKARASLRQAQGRPLHAVGGSPARAARVARRAATAQPRRQLVWGGVLAAAAVVMLALGLRDRASSESAPSGMRLLAAGATLTTGVGQLDSARLADGSRVVLGPASRLVVAASFGARGAARDVTLEGEGRFIVRHDEARPFTVVAGTAHVRDLGTTFTVRTGDIGARGTAGAVSVAVTEGIVSLGPARAAGDGALLLRAGDRGALLPGGATEVQRGAVTADAEEWTSGRLVYRDAPLARVRSDLRRWYGIDLQVPDSALAASRITTTIFRDPVDRVLESIALGLGARVERDGATAVLRPAGTGNRRTP